MNLAHIAPPPTVTSVAAAVAGPAALGLCVGLARDGSTMLEHAALFPALCLGLTLLMVPALYFAIAHIFEAPSARSVMFAALHGLRDAGIVLLGLSGAFAFLIATTLHPRTSLAFGAVGFALAALIGLRSVYRSIFAAHETVEPSAPPTAGPIFLYVAWSLVYLGLGASLYDEFVTIKGSL